MIGDELLKFFSGILHLIIFVAHGLMTNYGQNHDSFEACEHYVVPHLEVEGIMYVASERRWLV